MITKGIWTSALVFASFITTLIAGMSHQSSKAAPADKEIVIVAYGDSLIAGYQLPANDAFPVQLENALRKRGHNVHVINAGVSGDTAADGLARFDWTMPEKVDAVILELGANDSLRGLPIAGTRKALEEILSRLTERGIEVLLTGMEAPRNWGDAYTEEFRAMYRSLADMHNARLYPFFLEGVALDPSLNQSDGLHPNADGVAAIVENMMLTVEDLLERVKAKRLKES